MSCSKGSCGTQNGWWSKSHIGISPKLPYCFTACMWVYMRLDDSKHFEMPPYGYFQDFARDMYGLKSDPRSGFFFKETNGAERSGYSYLQKPTEYYGADFPP